MRATTEGKENGAGCLRIRVLLVNEQELRSIANGTIEAPARGFYTERHRTRWKCLERFAELFAYQLAELTDEPSGLGDWGPNLCGRLKPQRPRVAGQKPGSSDPDLNSLGSEVPRELKPEDNCFLRIHIPYPGRRKHERGPVRTR